MAAAPLEVLERLPPSFTAKTAINSGLTWRQLYNFRDLGDIIELSRGVYRKTDADPISEVDLLAVALRAPAATICLTAALIFWDLIDEMPGTIDLAVPRGARRPTITYPPTRVHVFDAATFDVGRIRVTLGQAPERSPDDKPDPAEEAIWITDIHRTIADAYRLRRLIGDDIANQALKTYLNRPRSHPGNLLRTAKQLGSTTALRTALLILL